MPRAPRSAFRTLAMLGVLSLMSACANHASRESATVEAAQYAARARTNYTPPGPAGDPWGPYIVEAAARFDVPEAWIRGVMRQESGGRLYEYGQLITSPTGAMGLMQIEPYTYDELRARYEFGADPYDPHENILAGTAYIRELYDAYGSPAFLAAYNAGPGRLDDYLTHNKGLPAETRHYVAVIGPGIVGYQPQHRSGAQDLALNQIPIDIPAGPRYPSRGRYGEGVAYAETRQRNGKYVREPVRLAALPEPPRYVPPRYVPPRYEQAAPTRLAAAQLAGGQFAGGPLPHTLQHGGGFHLIPRAVADTLPVRTGGPSTGGWAIQVGAFGNAAQAHGAASTARAQAGVLLASAHPAVGTVHQGHALLYRARLTGLSRDTAVQACERLSRKACIVLSPDAQS